MFRKPREAVAVSGDPTPISSTGRPPSPPSARQEQRILEPPMASQSTMASATTPILGRSRILPKKTPTAASSKGKGKPNGNIMNFFKKADPDPATECTTHGEYESLFLEDSPVKTQREATVQIPTPPREEASTEPSPQWEEVTTSDLSPSRYNEDSVPAKRRRIEGTPTRSTAGKPTPTGPFVDDSDNEAGPPEAVLSETPKNAKCDGVLEAAFTDHRTPLPEDDFNRLEDAVPEVPLLKKESTSIAEVNDFDGFEDFIDDEFPEDGEENIERRWMEEQAELELGIEEDDEVPAIDSKTAKEEDAEEGLIVTSQEAGDPSCPICGGNMAGISETVRLPQ